MCNLFSIKKYLGTFFCIFVKILFMAVIINVGKKLYSIGVGYINLAKSYLGVPKEQVEDLAVKRLSLCLACDKNVKNICRAGCNCVVIAKVRSANENCPLNKW
jgi:hypothetical protein